MPEPAPEKFPLSLLRPRGKPICFRVRALYKQWHIEGKIIEINTFLKYGTALVNLLFVVLRFHLSQVNGYNSF